MGNRWLAPDHQGQLKLGCRNCGVYFDSRTAFVAHVGVVDKSSILEHLRRETKDLNQ